MPLSNTLHLRWVSAFLAMLATTAGFAQYTHSKDSPAPSPLHAELVKTGLFLISGGGCNSLVRLSANGMIVVDGKLPGNYEALLALANKISDQPVRVLINTDHYPQHTGNNAKFLAAGAQILAHENLHKNLLTLGSGGAGIGAPTKTYDHDLNFQLGGIEAHVFHFGNAHTDEDTVVYFPNLKAVAIGDLFASIPDPDYSAGGSLVGWGPVLEQILKLDFDVAVPGTGPTITKSDLEAFKRNIDTLILRARRLVQSGVTKKQLMGRLKTDDLGRRFQLPPDKVDRFYAELAQLK